MNSRRNFKKIYIFIVRILEKYKYICLEFFFFFLIIKINGDSRKAYSIIHDTCNVRVAQVLVLF